MNSEKPFIYIYLFLILFVFTGCELDEIAEKGDNETKISVAGENESHRPGENCMNYHYTAGKGEGWFSVAGTLYNDSLGSSVKTSGTIQLFTGPNGSGMNLGSIEVDQNVNFYTTVKVDFSHGLYPSVSNNSGIAFFKSTPVKTGQCNLCHGTIKGKLWIF